MPIKEYIEDGAPSLIVVGGQKYTFANYVSSSSGLTQVWANVKTTANDLESWWVWIPRFAYKLESGTTKVILIDANNIPLDSTTYGNSLPEGYTVHEAFNQQEGLMGIWFGKYDPTSVAVEGSDELIMKMDNSSPWINITVSQSYAECEALNTEASTLKTSSLEAHLTTDYDWSIMAIFSASQYGAITSNAPNTVSTTQNNSGIYDIGAKNVQTTGLVSGTTSTSSAYISGLFDDSSNPKKYVNLIDSATGVDQNGKTCASFVVKGGTRGWLNGENFIGTSTSYPVSIKNGLFGVRFGFSYNGYGVSGQSYNKTTFRPVIWN